MKIALVAVVAFLAAPAVALGEASLSMREVPLHGERTLAAATPRFDMIGLHWRGSGSVEFRTRSVAGRWSGWQPAAPEAEDLPDVLSISRSADLQRPLTRRGRKQAKQAFVHQRSSQINECQ